MSADPRAYLFALAPALVVVAVGPGLAFALPPVVAVPLGPLRLFGLPVVVAGLGLAGWSVHAFARAGEPPAHTSEPSVLVTDGPPAYTRNPIYLGTVAAALGEALLFESVVLAAYALALWGVYHLLVVYREEPALRAALGEPYTEYRDRVPRWL